MPHVNYSWDDARAAALSPAERLVYRSNILGADQRITNTGGGNTSAKLSATDPLTGLPVSVLWVKGSGGDLRTSTLGNFASLYQDRLMQLQEVYGGMGSLGVKSPAEDHMVGLYPHCTFNLNPRATSIDTPFGRRGLCEDGRINARRGNPIVESWRMSVRPINPVAPVMRIMP